jgi:transposase-like protein
LEEILEDQMAAAVDRYLDQLQADEAADRRNGYYQRHLLTELGDVELNVPRTRRYSPVEVSRAYVRRTREIDRVILAGFVLGLSTRKEGETLLALLGLPPVSLAILALARKTIASFYPITSERSGWTGRLRGPPNAGCRAPNG